jgi:hypothetical protein
MRNLYLDHVVELLERGSGDGRAVEECGCLALAEAVTQLHNPFEMALKTIVWNTLQLFYAPIPLLAAPGVQHLLEDLRD